MAAITEDQTAALINSVGDFANGFLATQVSGIWDSHDGAPARLQYLYTRRDLIDTAMGEVRKQVTFAAQEDVGIDASDLLKGLLAMKRDVQRDIDQALASNPGVVVANGAGITAFAGELLNTGSTSLVGPTGWVDANSPFYRGSPYYTGPRRIV